MNLKHVNVKRQVNLLPSLEIFYFHFRSLDINDIYADGKGISMLEFLGELLEGHPEEKMNVTKQLHSLLEKSQNLMNIIMLTPRDFLSIILIATFSPVKS